MISADRHQPALVHEEVGWTKSDSVSQHCKSVEINFFSDFSAGLNGKKVFNLKLVTDKLLSI